MALISKLHPFIHVGQEQMAEWVGEEKVFSILQIEQVYVFSFICIIVRLSII